uniref:Uncharacterized protein n=1 Tax=Neogobius melanostomus TaxID=47308 RepID=A0A8C6UYM0_9GOBI
MTEPKLTVSSYLQADGRLDECGRGSWWLGTLKDTPRPGLYHIRDFIEESELNPVRRTYGFKGVGRRELTLGQRRGDLLLPGAYNLTDSTQEALKRQATYSFKNSPRPENVSYVIRDKTFICFIPVVPKLIFQYDTGIVSSLTFR